jgi:hypothetical protein
MQFHSLMGCGHATLFFALRNTPGGVRNFRMVGLQKPL